MASSQQQLAHSTLFVAPIAIINDTRQRAKCRCQQIKNHNNEMVMTTSRTRQVYEKHNDHHDSSYHRAHKKHGRVRLETMVHATQMGYGAACDLHSFLHRNAPNQYVSNDIGPSVPVSSSSKGESKHAVLSGSGAGRRRTDSVVDCYRLDHDNIVVIQPGF